MQLPLQTFSSLVQTMAASVQSAASQVLNLASGSVIRAILEANASVSLWLQWLILQVLQSTRAATSSGADLDTWMADFGLTRLPAVPANGTVTFSRYTPAQAALIPAGAAVRTADGSQLFTVQSAPSNPAWSAGQNGFVVAAGTASLDVPVVAQTAGVSGNVQSGTVTQLATAIAGIDVVANSAAFTGGLDAEADAAFRARFQTFLASRSRATPLAVAAAIASVQQGLTYAIQENLSTAGLAAPGNFVVTVDDGSGNPAPSLLAAVSAAIDAVRPVGSVFAVQPPAILNASVVLSLVLSPGASRPLVEANVAQALTAYIDALPIGAPLPITRLAQLAYAADPSIQNVTGLLINGGSADLVPPPNGVIKAASVTAN
jgi:uncharacterized phage protein gp47/JayE